MMEVINIPNIGTLEFYLPPGQFCGWQPVFNGIGMTHINEGGKCPKYFFNENDARLAGVAWAKRLILEGLATLDQFTPRSAPSYPPATPLGQRTRAISDLN